MGDVCLGIVMSLIALLCFVSSFQNKGIIGYRGLCLFIRNEKKKKVLYKISNRIFAILLIVGSAVYTFISFVIYGDDKYSHTFVISCIIYIILAGIVADILAVVIVRKSES